MAETDPKQENIIKRLNRIEGQVKGIRRMIESGVCCNDILVQVSAVKAAVSKVGVKILEMYAEKCIAGLNDEENKEKVLNELLTALETYMKIGT